MNSHHPLSKNLDILVKFLAPVRIFRCANEKFYPCNHSQTLDILEKLMDFDLEQYKNILKSNNNGELPNGYPFCQSLLGKRRFFGDR